MSLKISRRSVSMYSLDRVWKKYDHDVNKSDDVMRYWQQIHVMRNLFESLKESSKNEKIKKKKKILKKIQKVFKSSLKHQKLGRGYANDSSD